MFSRVMRSSSLDEVVGAGVQKVVVALDLVLGEHVAPIQRQSGQRTSSPPALFVDLVPVQRGAPGRSRTRGQSSMRRTRSRGSAVASASTVVVSAHPVWR